MKAGLPRRWLPVIEVSWDGCGGWESARDSHEQEMIDWLIKRLTTAARLGESRESIDVGAAAKVKRHVSSVPAPELTSRAW